MSSLADLDQLQHNALAALAACADEAALKAWNTRYSGEVNTALKKISTLPGPERKPYGQRGNQVKERLIQEHEAALTRVREQALERSLATDVVDFTLPGRPGPRGRLHPSTQTLRAIFAIFADLGFQVFRSPEVEDDETNFGLLNMPEHHPARDMWDTFHTTKPGVLLRTHTSPGQIHVMRKLHPKPIRAILPGMVYRYEAITARSEIQFNQVEGLVVGPRVTLADLIGTVTSFAHRLFGAERQVRIRSSYFPFTEPSIEVDMDCILCAGRGCRLCKGMGWLEIMGAGMVHPVVLRNGGYNPEKFSGFAFGMGPERIAMRLYGIDDIRQFWADDLRFLRQF
jgi:phenylalanyl-tRNA synthetase alpha chain